MTDRETSTGSAALDRLIEVLTPTPTGPDRFEGVGSTADGVDATFGGHFLGQAVAAALATVEPERRLHSLHATFLRGGRPGEPFTIEVERVRDGRSFCARRVRTHQDEGKTQFELMASCTMPEDGPELAASRPDDLVDLGAIAQPESLPTYGELMRSLDPLPLPEDWAMRDYGLDVRTVNAPWAPAGVSPHGGIRLWIRAAGTVPDDHRLHTALLVYQSDESLADCIAAPWGATWGSPGVVFVSLDHSVWFHRPVDLNDWLLLDQRPVTVAHGRGLATASVWDRAGNLVATITQEALFRLGDDFDGPG